MLLFKSFYLKIVLLEIKKKSVDFFLSFAFLFISLPDVGLSFMLNSY